MALLLRKATSEDLRVVLDILDYGMRNKVRRGDLAWGMSDHNPEAIRSMIESNLFYLALMDTIPVGTFALSWQDEQMWGKQEANAGYIQRFAVAAGYGGQDIGGQIIDLMLQEIMKQKRHYLRTAIPSGNSKLRLYYERHGFIRADFRITSPIHPAYAAAYYERATADAIQTEEISKKRVGFFQKIKTSKLFREGE